jgi:hypothetical protein
LQDCNDIGIDSSPVASKHAVATTTKDGEQKVPSRLREERLGEGEGNACVTILYDQIKCMEMAIRCREHTSSLLLSATRQNGFQQNGLERLL